MPLIKPFAGLRPVVEHAADVLAPPYDVLNSDEARERAQGKPMSFLHISKAEIDLPKDINVYDPQVYAKSAENMQALIKQGVLIRDTTPCYYVYRLTMGDHVQTGLVCVASVKDYNSNRIRKHEFTRPTKEDDRVRQIEALNAQTGPVLLAYKSQSDMDALLQVVTSGKPLYDIKADDGIDHAFWIVDKAAIIEKISNIFDAMPALYIADGHHRSAAASRIAARKAGGEHAMSQYFLAVIFPHNQMKILDYNRVITDLNGLSKAAFLEQIGKRFTCVEHAGVVKPERAGEFGMYLAGTWYRLNIQPGLIPHDPVKKLDVSLLADNLLQPVLGINDPRTDTRIDFIGGMRGLKELEKRVNAGEMAVAFALYATSMSDLMAVADSNQVMPPKSTWFEPKLADGLVSHVLD